MSETTAIEQAAAIRAVLDTLRRYYAGKTGEPHVMNATQIAVYLDGLARFSPTELESAARQHMRQSSFFPRLSDLLAILTPESDLTALAHLAWAELERCARQIGAYRTVKFVDPAFGQTVRQVFGSWAAVCSFDTDSPAWAIRRQTFLAVFPTMARRVDLEPVEMNGLHRHDPHPAVIGHLQGLPSPKLITQPDKSTSVIAEVQRRFLAAREAKDVAS